MRKTLRATALCLALSPLGVVGGWADTIINFDNVADGTNIDSAYAGVTFSCFSSVNACNGANTGDVYARASLSAASAPNIISTVQTGIAGTQDSTTGAIEVHFATAQSAVSIDDVLFQASEGLGTGGYGYLEAFDSNMNFIAGSLIQDVYGGNAANLGVVRTLSFSSAAGNISYLLLGDIQGANIISAFDNLCYSSDATGCSVGGGNTGGGGSSVPEPGMLSLFGTGLVALAGAGFRKRAVPANR